MVVDGITILKSASPITLLDEKPSENTVKFIQFFKSLPVFNEDFKDYRKLISVSEGGYDINQYLGKNINDLEILQNDFLYLLFKAVPTELFAKYNATEEHINQIILMLYFNAVVEIKYIKGFISQEFEYVSGNKNIVSRVMDFKDKELIAILIPFNASRAKLHRWIDDNGENIDSEMERYLVKSNEIFKRINNIGFISEVKACLNSDMTYSQICDKYSKYKILDENSLRSEVRRYEQAEKIFSGISTLKFFQVQKTT